MSKGMPPERNATDSATLQDRRWAGRTVAWPDNELDRTSKRVCRTGRRFDFADRHNDMTTCRTVESTEESRAFDPPAGASGTPTWPVRCVWGYYLG